ncbi:hypothetical protein NMY22_g12035 [Coprinellus aureogranulatus]|nr:hypothetical protein NMY22_g12035 [Coprinellus aureogranulatus]
MCSLLGAYPRCENTTRSPHFPPKRLISPSSHWAHNERGTIAGQKACLCNGVGLRSFLSRGRSRGNRVMDERRFEKGMRGSNLGVWALGLVNTERGFARLDDRAGGVRRNRRPESRMLVYGREEQEVMLKESGDGDWVGALEGKSRETRRSCGGWSGPVRVRIVV